MTRSIEALTPLERKQMLERHEWERERNGVKLMATCVATSLLFNQTSALFSKLSPSESDELDKQ